MNTAEDEEEKRRIESDENKTVYERSKGSGDHLAEELEKMVLESQINQEILTRILDKKDELIRKLILEIELHVEIDFESWAKRGDVEITDEEIHELLRIKNKQS